MSFNISRAKSCCIKLLFNRVFNQLFTHYVFPIQEICDSTPPRKFCCSTVTSKSKLLASQLLCSKWNVQEDSLQSMIRRLHRLQEEDQEEEEMVDKATYQLQLLRHLALVRRNEGTIYIEKKCMGLGFFSRGSMVFFLVWFFGIRRKVGG